MTIWTNAHVVRFQNKNMISAENKEAQLHVPVQDLHDDGDLGIKTTEGHVCSII